VRGTVKRSVVSARRLTAYWARGICQRLLDIPVVDVQSHQGESITGDLMEKAW
jgi:hypothetical protein